MATPVSSGIAVDRYRPGDEAAILGIWRHALPGDAIDEATFAARVLADVNFEDDGILVARQDDQPVGFALAVVRRVPMAPDAGLDPGTAWLFAFGVDPASQARGAGRALVDAAEAFARARGRRRMVVSGYPPGYVWPGVDRAAYPAAAALLEARGYTVVEEAIAMDRSLVGHRTPADVAALEARLAKAGYAFGPLSPRHVRGLFDMTSRSFGADWTRACREAVARQLPWDRILVCTRGDAVCGFAMVGAYDTLPERFGPFGVDPALRGLGLGKVLLYRAMADLAARGHHSTWFLWSETEGPAATLYRRTGFTPTRTFTVYEKDLGEAQPAG